MSLAVGAPVVTAGSVSKLSDILSQMRSTRRSKVCFTLMLSLALVSKNSKPFGGVGGGQRGDRVNLVMQASRVWLLRSEWNHAIHSFNSTGVKRSVGAPDTV